MRRYLLVSLLGVLLATALSTGTPFIHYRTMLNEQERINEHSMVYRKEWVNIQRNPVSSLNATPGQRIELDCAVSGSPPPQVYWVMGEDPEGQFEEIRRRSFESDINFGGLAQVESKKVIDCVTPKHQGLIHCVAVSGSKIAISSPTVLTVGGEGSSNCMPNAPEIVMHAETLITELDSPAVLPCRVSGRPRPLISWSDHEGNPLDTNDNYRFKVLSNGDLAIDNLQWEDMGIYYCQAKSALGEDIVKTFVYPMKVREDNNDVMVDDTFKRVKKIL